jgi:hypothetical protein
VDAGGNFCAGTRVEIYPSEAITLLRNISLDKKAKAYYI